VSRSITGLAQSVQDSIQENNRTMMQAISQMLHGVGFVPALQSSYTQGEYPLALGFKPPPDVSAKRLPAPAIQFTPPATLSGVPTPALGGTKENQSEERPDEAAVNDREQTPPTRAQDGGTRDRFGRSKQNDESEASEASSSGPPVRPGDLCSDQAKNTVPAPARTGNTERGRDEIPPQGCSEVVPPLRTPSPPDDDGDTPSMFRTMQCTGGSTGTSASIPSAGAGDIGKQGGDGKQSAGGVGGKSEQVEEEPLDYKPSPVREKDKEKTPPRDDDVYSLSTLSPPRQGHQKV
jgi:hypothetical protein